MTMTARRAANLLRPAPSQIALQVRDILADTNASSVVEQFHRLSYASESAATVRWLGVPVLKNPLDLWVYQDILFDRRPDVLIETGTHEGGSALFFASLAKTFGFVMDVVTVDINPKLAYDPGEHRIHSVVGISTTAGARREVADHIAEARRRLGRDPKVMVVLDSDHSRENVLEELDAYAPAVTPGDYLVVEDTNVNGHPVHPQHGAGPYEAVEEFLASNRSFTRDANCERFLLTHNPGGWLRRTA